ncbi:MAG: FG-GAP-like repeat-containing protein [Pseudomonadota bacterium]
MMAGSVDLADGLSFDAWISHEIGGSVLREIVVTFFNWIHTNQQGMFFGLAMAALLMCLLPLMSDELDRLLTRRFSATVAGTLLGTPLGVCVNCAAPIGYGMYQRGARLEAALATMLSSPTMNVVVLSMAFALFPAYLVLLKIAFSLLVIFIIIPALVAIFPTESLSPDARIDPSGFEMDSHSSQHTPIVERSLTGALSWFTRELGHQAWHLLRNVVPIMLLAGLLGSIAVVLLPWEGLIGELAEGITPASIVAMTLLALFGLFLPVPIAFDVVLAASLANAGMPVQYVAILLFVLGSFSVYSYLVLLRAGVRKVAMALTVALVCVGVLAGLSSFWVASLKEDAELAPLFDKLTTPAQTSTAEVVAFDHLPVPLDSIYGSQGSVARSADGGSVWQRFPREPAIANPWRGVSSQPQVERLPFNVSPSMAQGFTILPPGRIGLAHHLKPLLYNIINEYPDQNAIAAGDYNNDNWFDLLFSTSEGVKLYRNGGDYFEQVAHFRGDNSLVSLTAAAAIVDLDSDGWEDVIFSELDTGIWIAFNDTGRFLPPRRLPDSAATGRFAKSLGFADIDGDSQLEIFAGHISHMIANRRSSKAAENILYKNLGNREFEPRFMPKPWGETLSVWIGDIEGDGQLEIIEGNDFDEADLFYTVLPTFEVKPFEPGRIAASTRSTMSIDGADIDNDGDLEIYLGQVTQSGTRRPFRIPQTRGMIENGCLDLSGKYCELARALAISRRAYMQRDPAPCQTLHGTYELDCIAAIYYRRLGLEFDGGQSADTILAKAARFEPYYPAILKDMEHIVTADVMNRQQVESRLQKYTPQNTVINLLLDRQEEGSFLNRSVELGIDITGWTWNARFADYDGDGRQDLYVVNGHSPSELETTNVMFRNEGDAGFKQVTSDVGLQDFEPTLAYSYIDFDNDGDLDIVNYSQTGRVRVLRNDFNNGSYIQFQLADKQGNPSGIGARLTIHYGENNEFKQLRTLNFSGGHQSFDPKVMHFGIGDLSSVNGIEVQWADGDTTAFDGPFAAGYRYRISR